MNDDTLNPRLDDDRLDDVLSGVHRPFPGRGFTDRILARTRRPLPLWLVPARDWARGVTSGVRGWLLLALFSITTLGTWTLAGTAAWRERELIARGTEIATSELGVPAVQAVEGVREVIVGRLFDLLPVSIPFLKFFLILYAAVALVCVLGLWWLTRAPRAAEVHNA